MAIYVEGKVHLIKVGLTYINRKGETVHIVRRNELGFFDHCNVLYNNFGIAKGRDSDYNLAYLKDSRCV